MDGEIKSIYANEDEPISMDCPCGGKHYEGQLYIQKDVFEGSRVYMFTVIDFNGSEEGSTYLSRDQMEDLIEELKQMLE